MYIRASENLKGTNPADDNCNVCQNFGKPSEFYATHCQHPKSHINLTFNNMHSNHNTVNQEQFIDYIQV
jgi:hypothetical protein